MVFAPGVPVVGVCRVAGCSARPIAKGLCRRHYDRQRLTGSPVRRNRVRLCPWCKTWFEPSRKDNTFCSGKCRTAYCRAHARDAREYPLRPAVRIFDNTPPVEAPVPPTPQVMFTLRDVWEQCGRVCAVCGRPVVLADAAGVWATPIEDGGSPTLSNRRIVHRPCMAVMAGGDVRRQATGGRHGGSGTEGVQVG